MEHDSRVKEVIGTNTDIKDTLTANTEFRIFQGKNTVIRATEECKWVRRCRIYCPFSRCLGC